MSQNIYLIIAFVICSLITGSESGKCSSDQVNYLEYEVKSACILNFLKFIEFPPEEQAADNLQTINIAIVGENPAIDIIQKTLQNKTVENKHITLNKYPDVDHLLEDIRMHDVVYFVTPRSKSIAKTFPSLGKVARLTISEDPDFCRKGGMINFRIDNGKVRFDINPTAARQAKIKISSQLLKLARIVEQPSVTVETPKQNQKKQ